MAMRRFLFVPLLMMPLFLVGHYSGEPRRPMLGEDRRVEIRPVPLDESDLMRDRIGPLRFIGGWELRSPERAFGGFSGMIAEGDRLTLLNDAGGVVKLRLGENGGVSDVSFHDLPAGPDHGWARDERDSESMTWDPQSGRIWVGFENFNGIWRYSPDLGRGEAQAAPEPMALWRRSSGPETMLRLRSGEFLILPESGRGQGVVAQALLYAGDPTDPATPYVRFVYKPPKGYRPTDAAQLDDGRVLVLNRRFTLREWFTAKLSVIDPKDIREGKNLRGTEIASFASPVIRDNFEALAITHENGRQILWMASDDNFRSPFQRNLMLKFAVEGEF